MHSEIYCTMLSQGYEEVHVPALKPKEFASGEKLMPMEDLPSWARPAFKGMQTLNRVQSRVADMALKGVDNILLCAPTGAGKTNVAMLTILHEIGKNLNEDNTLQLDNFKVVYVAPMKVSFKTSTACKLVWLCCCICCQMQQVTLFCLSFLQKD